MSEEKRIISTDKGDYEIKDSINLGGKEYILAENIQSAEVLSPEYRSADHQLNFAQT